MASHRIIRRAEWGAKYDNGVKSAPLPAEGVWAHHSVTIAPDLVPPFDDDYAAVRTLEQIGESRFGRGISYTFAITPAGLVFEGHGIDREGSHTAGHNRTHRAICFVGNYEEQQLTAAQVEAAAWLLAHGFLAGWWRAAAFQGGHRDVKATACPGRHVMARLRDIDARAAALVRAVVTPPAPPHAVTVTDRLASGATLFPGQHITSADGRFLWAHQKDGNVVLYDGAHRPLWASGTHGRATTAFVMQDDGNLVLYNGSTPVWHAGTHGNPGSWFVMQTDGNAVVYAADGRPLWATGTDGGKVAQAAGPSPEERAAALPVLREGSRGDHVRTWQRVVGAAVDGVFGPKTKAATQAWQRARGLAADGIVGPRTWAAAIREGRV